MINLQSRLKLGKEPTNYNSTEYNYIRKPIGNALYRGALDYESIKNDIEARKTPWDPKQKIKCTICGNIINRSNRSIHEKSKIHTAFLQINTKMKQFLLE